MAQQDDIWRDIAAEARPGAHESVGPLVFEDLGPCPGLPQDALPDISLLDARLQSALGLQEDGVGTFAILDASKLPGLADLLGGSGCPHACLFKGKSAEDLGDSAPWLVQLRPSDRLFKDLVSEGDAPWQLWHDRLGVFVTSRLSFFDLYRHLRKFTRLPREDAGQWIFFKFWEVANAAPIADAHWLFPTFVKIYAHILSAGLSIVFPDPKRVLHVRSAPIAPAKLVAPPKPEARRLLLHSRMIGAADDILTFGPDWVGDAYPSRHDLSLSLRDFIEFCLATGVADPDIRGDLMTLLFATDCPRWPECWNDPLFARIWHWRADRPAEDLAQDWIYHTRHLLQAASQEDG